MGALVASKCNPVIHEFYQRLLAAGKSKKVALTACMRKLLVITQRHGQERGILESQQHRVLTSKTVALVGNRR